jgi:2-aminobenzoate-CoA ligase
MERSGHQDSFARDNLPPAEDWPEFLLDTVGSDYPARMNCAVDLLDAQVHQGNGARPALRWLRDGKRQVMTYAELQGLVNRIAHVLTEDLGLIAGNRLLLRGPNTPMMAAGWLAAIKAGLVTVPTMPLLRAKELKQIIDKAQVHAVLCDHALRAEAERCLDAANEHFCPGLESALYFNDASPTSLDTLAAAKPDHFDACDTAADDVCLIAFTSGTTGVPKGCMHFHRDVLLMCDIFSQQVIKPTSDDIFCGTPPLAFTFGLGGLLCFPLRAGASVVLLEKLTPALLLQTVQDFKASIVFTAPTFYRQMSVLAGNYDIASLRKTISAGEALSDATRCQWRAATGIEMIDGIGGTEMIHVFISSCEHEVRPGAIGRVLPGYQALVVDDQMKAVPVGKPGRLALRGPTGCRYLADPRQREFVRDGWNLPGDTFVMDADGYFFYQARNDDMIVSAGYNIAGPEVEDALLHHPAVAECGVVGQADEERGQVVKAYVVLNAGHAASELLVKELQNFVKNSVAPYKYPRAIEFVDTLPRTENGKLQRNVLRNWASRQRVGATPL